jgi:hypothetical protein
MPLANVRFLTGSGPVFLSSTGLLAIVLFAGCSSPKAAAVSSSKSVPVVADATGHPKPADADPGTLSDPFVAAVRAGTISGYSQATIGQAFEAAFSDAHWTSQQPNSGVRVVTFTGFLPANMRPACGSAKADVTASPCLQNARVTFEWTFASDGRFFHLSHVDPEPWPETHRSTREMLLFIYG